jgi:hypothetical protein
VLDFVLARLLAGRSCSHRDLGLAVGLSLVALPTLGLGAALALNRFADPGPPTVRRVPVLEVRHHREEGEHVSHYAVVPDWSGTGTTRRIQLGRALAERTVAGQSTLRVTTSPGRLGAERLLALELESGADGR